MTGCACRLAAAAGCLFVAALSTAPSEAGQKRQTGRSVRPPSAVEELRHMAPKERREALSSLSPERRSRVEERLKDYDSLPPGKREQLNRAYQRFSELTPEQQNSLRQSFNTFSQLSPRRKQALARELRRLRGMPPGVRQKRFNSKAFQSRFTPGERDIVRHMSEFSVPAPE